MNYKNIFMLIVVIGIVILVVTYFTDSKKKTQVTDTEILNYEEHGESNFIMEKEDITNKKTNDYFYQVPSSLWPKITVGGTFTAVITYVAFFFGIASFFIGYYASGKSAKIKMFVSILTATIIGVFGRAIIICVEIQIFNGLKYIFSENELLAATIAGTITYIVWIFFIAGISVYFYETFTVTAEEAFQRS